MSSPVSYDIQGSIILLRPGPDAPEQVIELCKGAPSRYTESGTEYMLSTSYAGKLRAAMRDRRTIDRRIAAPTYSELSPPWVRPPGLNLYSHQASGIQFLIDRRSAMLADDMGLGKTLQAILAAEYARCGGKVLVVCPAGLIGNWLSELEKWAPNVSARIQFNRDFDLEHNYSIVSYDTGKMSGALRNALLSKEWGVVIMDESHCAKGMASQRYDFLTRLRAWHRWQLTGTPMLNRPGDLLGLLRIGRHPLGRDIEKFQQRFVTDDRDSLRISKTLGLELSAWIMRRYKDDVLDLPKKRRVMQGVMTANYTPERRGELMKQRVALAQAKTRATYDTMRTALNGTDRNVIIFSAFHKPLDMLEAALRGRIPYARIDGNVSGAKRRGIVEAFQAGKTRVLLGQINAAGLGLTLTKATTVIFNDLSYVPADHAQAEDRCYRIGQDSDVSIYYMLGRCPLDQALWELLEVKRKNIGKFEEGLRSQRDVEVSPDELLDAIRNRHRRDAGATTEESTCSSPKPRFEITSWPRVSK